ncbi:hypothetical protein L596_018381 [Steinernema carpocapsae]|uniref:Uncharacterized protein n=1 Tax=Steinernema carpocapsae TaxID=34508 RepID=A0A4U5N4R5_STECR|nr:hypothetical protein L596_018381 [Steinernema carpocapsae]
MCLILSAMAWNDNKAELARFIAEACATPMVVPDEVMVHLLTTHGVSSDSPHVERLLALKVQHTVTQILKKQKKVETMTDA